MKDKINKIIKCCGVLALFISIIFYQGCAVFLPPIKGTVLYGDQKTPVSDAYIICTTYKYPLTQAINVGGPNWDFNDVEIVKTDINGNFITTSYNTISLSYLNDIRHFIIYKPGYSALSYSQCDSLSFHDYNTFPWIKRIKAIDVFVINNKIINYNKDVGSVITTLKLFSEYFKHNDINNYNKHLDEFKEIYSHLWDDYVAFANSKNSNPVIRGIIASEMKDLRYYLGLED